MIMKIMIMKKRHHRFFLRYKEKIKRHFEEVIKIKRDPHAIASGFALGTFIAILPTFGFGIFIGLLLILIFKRISKISLLLSFAFWNPLILALIYPICYGAGSLVLSNIPSRTYEIEILNQIFVYSRRFLVGSFVLAVTLAIAGYLLVLVLIYRYYKKSPRGVKEEVRELKKTFRV